MGVNQILGSQPVSITSPQRKLQCGLFRHPSTGRVEQYTPHTSISAQKLHAWMLEGVQASRPQG